MENARPGMSPRPAPSLRNTVRISSWTKTQNVLKCKVHTPGEEGRRGRSVRAAESLRWSGTKRLSLGVIERLSISWTLRTEGRPGAESGFKNCQKTASCSVKHTKHHYGDAKDEEGWDKREKKKKNRLRPSLPDQFRTTPAPHVRPETRLSNQKSQQEPTEERNKPKK